MTSEIETTEPLSFCAALVRLDELAQDMRSGNLDERLVRLAEDVAEAHQLKHILLDRAAEVREAIASLRGTARPPRPA
jgi:predicted secreted protein